jgi:hypothetical protein
MTRTVSATTARSRSSRASRPTRTRPPNSRKSTKYRASPSVASTSAQESDSELNDPPASRTRAGSNALSSQPMNHTTKNGGPTKPPRSEVKTEDEEPSVGNGKQKKKDSPIAAQDSESDLNDPSPRRTRAGSSISLSQSSNHMVKKVGRPKKAPQVQSRPEDEDTSIGWGKYKPPSFSGQDSEVDSNDLPLTRSRAGSSASTIQTSNHGVKKPGRSKAPRSGARTHEVEDSVGRGKQKGASGSTEESEPDLHDTPKTPTRGGLPTPASQDSSHAVNNVLRSKSSPREHVEVNDSSINKGKEKAVVGISADLEPFPSGPAINGISKPLRSQPPDSPTPRKQRSQPQFLSRLQNDLFDSRPLQSNAISDTTTTLEVLSPFLNTLPPGGIAPAQLDMTIQEFIVSETQRAYDAMKRDGERLKREFLEESKRQRAIIVERLMKIPTTLPSE